MKKRIEVFERIPEMPEYLREKIEDTDDVNVIIVFFNTHDPQNDYERSWWYLVDNNSFHVNQYTYDLYETDGEFLEKGTIVVLHH